MLYLNNHVKTDFSIEEASLFYRSIKGSHPMKLKKHCTFVKSQITSLTYCLNCNTILEALRSPLRRGRTSREIFQPSMKQVDIKGLRKGVN